MAVGTEDSSIFLMDLRTVGKVGTYVDDKSISAINQMQFSKSGRILFSCSASQTRISAWDVINECKAAEFGTNIHKDGIKTICLARDGYTLVSADKGGTIALW